MPLLEGLVKIEKGRITFHAITKLMKSVQRFFRLVEEYLVAFHIRIKERIFYMENFYARLLPIASQKSILVAVKLDAFVEGKLMGNGSRENDVECAEMLVRVFPPISERKAAVAVKFISQPERAFSFLLRAVNHTSVHHLPFFKYVQVASNVETIRYDGITVGKKKKFPLRFFHEMVSEGSTSSVSFFFEEGGTFQFSDAPVVCHNGHICGSIVCHKNLEFHLLLHALFVQLESKRKAHLVELRNEN